ncbi:urea transporter 2-like [Portunus trituberculatus]|uniref:urea transporter 2-like n=1 Tax=Portunus trituberculatus TaxID=210409 RepID=UPI001E1D05A5|nr:urea transporter 2-like [Portunus trituberculatus]
MSNEHRKMPGFLGWVASDAEKLSHALAGHRWLSPWGVLRLCDCLLRGVAQVVFVNNPLSGLLILIGLFVADVTVAGATVFCTIIAFFVAKVLLDLPDGQISAGLPLFSPVLVGSVTASLFTLFFHSPITPAVWGYMGLAAALSVCIFAGLNHLLASHNLPAYTLPFNIATALIFLGMRGAGYGANPTVDTPSELPSTTDSPAFNSLENVTLVTPDDSLQERVCLGMLLSSGQVWAVESVACSVLVGIAMLLCSPLLTAACFVGGAVGTLTALVVSEGPYAAAYAGVWGYNGFLAGGAMLFFVVASPRVVVLAVLNALLATFIQSALVPVFGQNSLPVFTFPFCLASLLFLAAVSSSSSFHRVASPSFPEMHLLQHHQESSATQERKRKEETSADMIA